MSDYFEYPAPSEHYDAGDIWSNYQNTFEFIDETVDNINKQFNEYNEYAYDLNQKLEDIHRYVDDSIEVTWQRVIDRTYVGYGGKKRTNSCKTGKSMYRLARPEIMVPAQQTIENRWQKVKHLMAPPEPMPELPKPPFIFRRAPSAVMAGLACAATDFIFIPWAEPAIEGGQVGGAFMLGAGYVFFKGRNKRNKKHDLSEQYVSPEELSEEQMQVLRNHCSVLYYGGGELDHWADEITEEELTDAVSHMGGKSLSTSVSEMLKWIDNATYGADWYDRNSKLRPDEKVRSLNYLSTFSKRVKCDGIDAAYQLISKSGRQRPPLALLALVRMENRGSFMNDYAEEFSLLQNQSQELADLGEEHDQVNLSMQSVGRDSAYFKLRLGDIEQRMSECMKAMALQDLRIAALAYAYDKDSVALAHQYQPHETEDFYADQIALWQDSITQISTMPLHALSPTVADFVVAATNKCLNLEQSGRFGNTARGIAEYVYKFVNVDHDESEAVEALQSLDSWLFEQKAIK